MNYGFEEKILYKKGFPFHIICSDTPSKMLPHWHSSLELMYFYKTEECKYCCRDNVFHVKDGDLMVVNSAELHECNDFAYSSVCCITLDTDMLCNYKGILFCNHIENDPEIACLFHKIKSVPDSPISDFAYAGYVYEILALLLKKYVSGNSSSGKRNIYNLYSEKVKNIMTFIAENLTEDLNSDMLAQQVNLSKSRFYHVFKEITGVKPSEYIEKTRISHACCLLKNTDTNISEVADSCGFSDHSYFTQRFRLRIGMSPKNYRALHFPDNPKGKVPDTGNQSSC